MTSGVLEFLGGIGLFLFGMEVMTAALRDSAGLSLRGLMARFTSTPVRGAATGALASALTQSSSAVAVMTIGFVGAGVIGFTQSISILIGSNFGRTATAWAILLLGVKVKIGTAALPLLFVASLMGMIGQGHIARLGRFLSGLSLLFIGLDMLQTVMAGAETLITPAFLPGDGWGGRFVLAGIGILFAAALNSSAAGIALLLVLLGAGSVTLGQAIAVTIGLAIGTTATGLLASAGGTRPMRLTGIANTGFNIGAALVALPLMGPLQSLVLASGAGDQTALVLFDTLFNLIGVALFLPWTGPVAAVIERAAPYRQSGLSAGLNRRLLRDEGAALDAAETTARAISRALAQALSAAVAPAPDLRPLAALPAQVNPALAALEDWLSRIRIAPDHTDAAGRYVALLHLHDHLHRQFVRATEMDRIAALAQDPVLLRAARVLAAAMMRDADPARMGRLAALIEHRARRYRRSTLLREHAGMIEVRDVFRLTDAMRWLERSADHAERIATYLDAAGHGLPVADVSEGRENR